MHLLAAEPLETILRVAVIDGSDGAEVAYEAVVFGSLRPGYRSIPLRSRLGTYIEGCALLVHLDLTVEENHWEYDVSRMRSRLWAQADALEAQECELQLCRQEIAQLQQLLV